METSFTTALHVVQLIVELLGFLVIIFRGGQFVGQWQSSLEILREHQDMAESTLADYGRQLKAHVLRYEEAHQALIAEMNTTTVDDQKSREHVEENQKIIEHNLERVRENQHTLTDTMNVYIGKLQLHIQQYEKSHDEMLKQITELQALIKQNGYHER